MSEPSSEAVRGGRCAESAALPPEPKKIPHRVEVHGQVLEDPYFWLRERENPEVLAHLEKENAYTGLLMKPTEAIQEALYREMLGRIKETDTSAPSRHGPYFYYARTEKGKQYSIYCRKRGSLEAPEEILLDCNELAQGQGYFRLGVLKVSPDHKLLAYSTDFNGSETYRLFFKDLQAGRLLGDVLENTYASAEWAADNKTLFYTVLDATQRPYRLMRHALGADPAGDEIVFEEPDEAYFLTLSKTKDRKYLVMELASKVTSEAHVLDAARPLEKFSLIHPREHRLEYSVEHHEGKFLILTNDKAVNFRLMQAPVDRPAKVHWQEIIPARDKVKIDGLDVFGDFLAVYERENGLNHILIRRWDSGSAHRVEFPESVYTAEPGSNPEYESKILRFEYTSLVTPYSIFDYDMETRKRELKKEQEVVGGYDKNLYFTERLWAKSQDGESVPVSIVARKGFAKDGSHPLFLYGYGAYGLTVDPIFSAARLSLLDRGFIFAIAHIRGGGDLGRPWYETGKFLKKKNTFFDFIAAAEHLVKEKYTSPGKLVISGGSAGGLLMGAVANLRPELFHAVIAKVPFVDVVNTMLDKTLPLTVTEYDEWGNPEDKTYFDYIRSYSPYDNVEPKAYPNFLITGGLNDPRVSYWEPAKWAARLRERKTNQSLVLLKMQMGAGHGGPSGRYEALRELAFEYAFLFKVLGIPA